MTRVRIAPRAQQNPGIVEMARGEGEGNLAWLTRALERLGPGLHVVLLGGTDLIEFRLRVAQSQLRADMLPSYWSHALTLHSDVSPDITAAWHIDLSGATRLAAVPGSNAIQRITLDAFHDLQQPNIALLHFPAPPDVPAITRVDVEATVADLHKARLVEDLVTPLVRWLAFVWGAQDATNPLLQRTPMPSARLTELIFSALGIDINPSTAGHFTCPEAIWNAALWWNHYYEGTGREADDPAAQAPRGVYTREPFITLIG